MSLPLTDTRFFFRPLSADLVALLRTLSAEAWRRPTLAGSWLVRDVVAHLLDTTLRRALVPARRRRTARPAGSIRDRA